MTMKIKLFPTSLLLSLIAFWVFNILACASTDENSTSPLIYSISDSEYEETIEPYTQSDKKYNGLQNTMDLSITFLNSKVLEAQLKRQATVLAWTQVQYAEQKTKKFDGTQNESKYFISFFTPDKKSDDLGRSETLWKIFLETDGRRFEGKVEKMKGLTQEIALLFPDHNKFATPYVVKFPVALSSVESKVSKIILTGPVGKAQLDFPSL